MNLMIQILNISIFAQFPESDNGEQLEMLPVQPQRFFARQRVPLQPNNSNGRFKKKREPFPGTSKERCGEGYSFYFLFVMK